MQVAEILNLADIELLNQHFYCSSIRAKSTQPLRVTCLVLEDISKV